MKFQLEKYSFRSGELFLNSSPQIKTEIEDILLGQGEFIGTMSRDEYVAVLRQEFLARGWENRPSILDTRGKPIPLMDFRKERIGVRLGLQPSSPQPDLVKFQTAKRYVSTMVDLGIYVAATAKCQQQLARESGKLWAGPNFNTVTRCLPSIGRLLEVPVCVLGLEAAEVLLRSIDIETMPPHKLKELILDYLENSYGNRVHKNVRVMGKKVDETFDGVISLPEKDVILAVEMSRSTGNFPTRLLSDSISDFIEAVRQYRKITRPDVCLRFILLGPFSGTFIQNIFGSSGTAYGWAEGIEVEYEMHSFDEFEVFLSSMRQISEMR